MFQLSVAEFIAQVLTEKWWTKKDAIEALLPRKPPRPTTRRIGLAVSSTPLSEHFGKNFPAFARGVRLSERNLNILDN